MKRTRVLKTQKTRKNIPIRYEVLPVKTHLTMESGQWLISTKKPLAT